MDDAHKICELEKEVTVLKQKSSDDDKALILAKDISSARWTAGLALTVAILTGLFNIISALSKR